MSQKNKAPKLYVVEKKTASGKGWSKKIVAEARTFSSAVDKLVAVPGKSGDYRVRRLSYMNRSGDTHPTKVLATRTYAAPVSTDAEVLDRLTTLVNA